MEITRQITSDWTSNADDGSIQNEYQFELIRPTIWILELRFRPEVVQVPASELQP